MYGVNGGMGLLSPMYYTPRGMFGCMECSGGGGLGAVTAQEVSTAAYVLGQDTWASVANLAQLIQDPFYGLTITPADAILAAQQGMSAVISQQNPGVPAAAVVSAVIALGNGATIQNVTPTLPAPTLATGTYMAPNALTPAQQAAQAAMAAASEQLASSTQSQQQLQTQMQAAAGQYNVPVPAGYMSMPNTGIMTSGNPNDPLSMLPTVALGTGPNTALIGGQSTVTPAQMAALTPANAIPTTPVTGPVFSATQQPTLFGTPSAATTAAIAASAAAQQAAAAAGGDASTQGAPTAAGGATTAENWFMEDSIISGVPNWTFAAGGGVLLLFMFMHK